MVWELHGDRSHCCHFGVQLGGCWRLIAKSQAKHVSWPDPQLLWANEAASLAERGGAHTEGGAW